jgi:hypothetical protein
MEPMLLYKQKQLMELAWSKIQKEWERQRRVGNGWPRL